MSLSKSAGGAAAARPAWSRAAFAVVMLGVVLRVVQWLANPSLWLDELQLVRNILDRRIGELLVQGLDHGQAAPVGFLLPVKVVTLILGDSEPALRIVPIVASILALVLFWRLAQSLLAPLGMLVATTAFALNPLLISLSSVVKQYATDVLVTVIILLVVQFLRDGERSLRTRMLVGVGAGTVGFLSIPSIMVTGAAITALLYRSWQRGALRRVDAAIEAVGPLVAWCVGALGAALWARKLAIPVAAYMRAYWTQAGGFAPPFTEYPTWVLERWSGSVLPEMLLRPYIGEAGVLGSFLIPHLRSFVGWAVLVSGLILSAAAVMISRGFGWAIALLLPFPIALGLARLEIYPMDGRTSVFLLPLILVLIGALASWFVASLPTSIPWLRAAVPALLVMFFSGVLIDRPPSYTVQRDREVIRELALRRSPGDPVLAHPWSGSALAYYGSRFKLENGVVYWSDASAVDALKGESTLWVLFTHSMDRDFLLCYLDEVGLETDRVVFPGGMPHNPASLHRYDLSDEARWSSFGSAHPPVTATDFEGNPPRCRRQDW